LKAFNDTLEILHQKATSLKNKENEAGKGEAPVWVQDSEVKACACCGMHFSSLLPLQPRTPNPRRERFTLWPRFWGIGALSFERCT
jgi:hypothetical protein